MVQPLSDTTYTEHAPDRALASADDQYEETSQYWSLGRIKRAYMDYLGSKRFEIDEQKQARCYRHGAQWTTRQVEIFEKRKQPVVTYNRIGRKIDAIVGLMEKLKQDPKAYPVNPRQTDEMGAELATAAVRYVVDSELKEFKFPFAIEDGAVDGLGGVEMMLVRGDKGDTDVAFARVLPDSFFYDPRSYIHDFEDARYLGQGKWLDIEEAMRLAPDKAAELAGQIQAGYELTSNPDRERLWYYMDRYYRRVRVVEIWYKHRGIWCWCLFTGFMKLDEGEGYFFNEKGEHICKYIMYSSFIDQDGDRYGFVRNLRSSQDEINQRRSKGLHELNSRRIKAEEGAFADIEVTRREAVRPDGVVIYNKGFEMEFDDQARIANMEGQLKFLEDAKNEIENFGPSPALIGQGLEYKSGRAINLLQQAGIAELGPFVIGIRNWKLRIYRAIWNAVQRYWQAERWIRVTDDMGVAQLIQVNGVGVDEQTGLPRLVNAIGQLDVNFVLDEGPDEVNMMADAYDTLVALSSQGAKVPPAVLLELAPLHSSLKRKLLAMLQQPDPVAQASQAADIDETKSRTTLNLAKAQETAQGDPTAHVGVIERVMDAQLNAQQHQFKQAEAATKIQIEREKGRAKVVGDLAKLHSDQVKSGRELLMETVKHAQSLGHAEEKHAQTMRHKEAEAKAKRVSASLPGYQFGGRPEVGKPAMVGEDGPEVFVPDQPGTIVPLTTGKGGRVSPSALKGRLEELLYQSPLVGRPPPGGKTGSRSEWADFMTRLVGKESSYDPTNVGDIGKFGGHGSRGLFQLSPQDAVTYGLQKTPFTHEQLADPEFNARMAVKIAERLGPDKMGQYWGPIARGFSLTSEGRVPEAPVSGAPAGAGGLAGLQSRLPGKLPALTPFADYAAQGKFPTLGG